MTPPILDSFGVSRGELADYGLLAEHAVGAHLYAPKPGCEACFDAVGPDYERERRQRLWRASAHERELARVTASVLRLDA
jgi:hypothetical protein